MPKLVPSIWPRLTESRVKLPWLKTDFSKLSDAVIDEMMADEEPDDKVEVKFVSPTDEERVRQ